MALRKTVVRRLERLARKGVPLTRACSHVGISQVAAYRGTQGRRELRIVRPRLTAAQRQQLDELIAASDCSYSQMAKRVGCSKSTVLRRRDAMATKEVGKAKFCRCRTSYRCPECGGKVVARPCPACEATRCHNGG